MHNIYPAVNPFSTVLQHLALLGVVSIGTYAWLIKYTLTLAHGVQFMQQTFHKIKQVHEIQHIFPFYNIDR